MTSKPKNPDHPLAIAAAARRQREIAANYERIVELKDAGLTQRQIAKQLDIAERSISEAAAKTIPSVKRRWQKPVRLPQYEKAELLAALRKVADDLGVERLSTDTYRLNRSDGMPAASTIAFHFGSWQAACEAAGLIPYRSTRSYRYRYDDADLLLALAECAATLRHVPTYPEYVRWASDHDKAPGGGTIRMRFGSWLKALDAAGF